MIWIFSTALFASDNTGRYLLRILRWFDPEISMATYLWIHGIVRKGSHFAEYFVFSLLLLRGIRAGQHGWRLGWGLATLAIAAAYASLDEVHQAFVPQRTASVMDVSINIAGAAAAQLLAWWHSSRGPTPEKPAGARVADGLEPAE